MARIGSLAWEHLRRKAWSCHQVLVAETSPIEFKADAFEQLVLPAPTKEIIRRSMAEHGGAQFRSAPDGTFQWFD